MIKGKFSVYFQLMVKSLNLVKRYRKDIVYYIETKFFLEISIEIEDNPSVRTHVRTRATNGRLSGKHPRILGIRFHPRVACAINIARIRVRARVCAQTVHPRHSSSSLFPMRFVRLRQVLRGRAPRWRKSQGCFVRRGSMTRCCFRRKNSGPDPLRESKVKIQTLPNRSRVIIV